MDWIVGRFCVCYILLKVSILVSPEWTLCWKLKDMRGKEGRGGKRKKRGGKEKRIREGSEETEQAVLRVHVLHVQPHVSSAFPRSVSLGLLTSSLGAWETFRFAPPPYQGVRRVECRVNFMRNERSIDTIDG